MEIWPAIITLVGGFLGAVLCQELLNWPGGGAVVAVAVMGYCILRDLRILKERLEENNSED